MRRFRPEDALHRGSPGFRRFDGLLSCFGQRQNAVMSQLALKLGAPVARRKPGWKAPEWRAWQDARRRCNSPRDKDYADYGGRGIRVCAEWDKPGGFALFFAHVGPRPDGRHTLDRINVNGDYEPGNVRWATWTEQANNRRSSKLITWRGQRRSAADWARLTGIPRQQIANRINRGWSVQDALTTPVKRIAPANDNDSRRATPSREVSR